MRITFLGTSAGEGYPGFWCECPNCTYAREKGGRNLRGNTCTLIDEDLLVDMNTHFFEIAPRMNISVKKIKTLLVTHPHKDHFAPQWLLQRAMPREWIGLPEEELHKRVSPCFTDLPVMQIYGNSFVRRAMEATEGLIERLEECRLEFHEIRDGVEERCGDVRFIPLRSQHTNQRGFAHSYIIYRDGKCLLYASDTGGYDEDMMEILLAQKYDGVIVENTFGLGARIDGHMNLEKNRELLEKLNRAGVWKNGQNMHLTHICPHWAPPHDIYAPMLEKEGLKVAYDGKVIEL